MDSNHDKALQRRLCYRYTTRQEGMRSIASLPKPSISYSQHSVLFRISHHARGYDFHEQPEKPPHNPLFLWRSTLVSDIFLGHTPEMPFLISRSFILIVALVLPSLVGCQTTDPQDKDAEPLGGVLYRGVTFTARHAPTVNVVTDSHQDFAVHYFRPGKGREMMGIYEGQHPKLFSSKEHNLSVMRKSLARARPGLERGDDVWGVDSNGKFWRESIWSCNQAVIFDNGKREAPLPVMIHIWYFGVSDEIAAVYDQIIDSIEIVQPYQSTVTSQEVRSSQGRKH